jgi:hypothetical protein
MMDERNRRREGEALKPSDGALRIAIDEVGIPLGVVGDGMFRAMRPDMSPSNRKSPVYGWPRPVAGWMIRGCSNLRAIWPALVEMLMSPKPWCRVRLWRSISWVQDDLIDRLGKALAMSRPLSPAPG